MVDAKRRMAEDQLNVDDDQQEIASAFDVSVAELPILPLINSSSEPKTATGCLQEDTQLSRKEKRKNRKKLRRKQLRQDAAEKAKLIETARLQDPEEQLRIQLEEEIEAQRLAKEKAEHDEQERLWIEREMKAMEDFQRRQEELRKKEEEAKCQDADEEGWKYVEDDGPAEIIWQGNEIIVRKRRVKVPSGAPGSEALKDLTQSTLLQDVNRSTSNPLPPPGAASAVYKYPQTPDVTEQASSFGTEQDKTHCPFHIKTGVCRFGVRCSRVHVYPDQSFTLLMRNMYTGPGLVWENDDGLEHSDEEVAQHYEEFYEDVHSEFIQFGELVNFKVCKNASSHLRGNVYVHYKTEASAQAAYSAMNGRFYAGKQITCEFVGVTRWRIALCGEYMKGHHRPCSHGTACNFLHCFRNPRGEYDWADWEGFPPRYWLAKMAKLFDYEKDLEKDENECNEQRRKWCRSSYSPRRRESRYREHKTRDGLHHSTRENSEHASRHRDNRRHKTHGDYYHSDSDEMEKAQMKWRRHRRHRRERSRDGHLHSTSKEEMGRRDRGNGRDTVRGSQSSDEETTTKNYYMLKGEQGQKEQSCKTDHHYVDEESSDGIIRGRKRVKKRHRTHFHNDSIEDTQKDNKHDLGTQQSLEDLKDSNHRRSLDLSRKGRQRTPSSDIESQMDQIVLENKDEAGNEKGQNKVKETSLLDSSKWKSSHSRRSEHGGSSDSNMDRSNRRHRSHHHKNEERNQGTRRKSHKRLHSFEGQESKCLDKDS